jgi:hypothetical protein
MNHRAPLIASILVAPSVALYGCPSALVGGQCAPGWVETADRRCVRADAAADEDVVVARDGALEGGIDASFDGDFPIDGAYPDVALDDANSDSSSSDRPEDALPSNDGASDDGTNDVHCVPPLVHCDGACVNLADDRAHCGACGRACMATELCSLRACVPRCAAPLIECAGMCVDPNSDPEHCGGCGVRCPTGICNGGRCRAARAGHMILIGSDYETSRPPQDTILVNSVALSSRGAIRLLTFARYADGGVRARIEGILDAALGPGRLRRTSLASEVDLSRELTVDRYDALLVYDQRSASAAQLSAIAALWSDALSGFARAGGTVILLDGANPARGTWMLARESGLLPVTDADDADAITVRLVPSAAADAVASGVDVLFVASRNTVRYRTSSSAYAVFADNAEDTRPVVLHRAVLP